MNNDIMEQSRIWSSYEVKSFRRYDSGIDPNKRSAWFVNQLEKYDFLSVLEVGVCTGRNLKYISEKFPDAMLSGIDVNSGILAKARAQVPSADIMVKDIYDLKEDKKWDLVFTMGVLIHIHPDGIKDVIKKCTSVSNKYIIHIEQYGDGSVITGPKELNPEGGFKRLHWRPNIVKIYKELGFDNITVIDVPGGFNECGASHMISIDIR